MTYTLYIRHNLKCLSNNFLKKCQEILYQTLLQYMEEIYDCHSLILCTL